MFAFWFFNATLHKVKNMLVCKKGNKKLPYSPGQQQFTLKFQISSTVIRLTVPFKNSLWKKNREKKCYSTRRASLKCKGRRLDEWRKHQHLWYRNMQLWVLSLYQNWFYSVLTEQEVSPKIRVSQRFSSIPSHFSSDKNYCSGYFWHWFLFPMRAHVNETAKLFMKLFSVLRIPSKEIMHQTYLQVYMKDKEIDSNNGTTVNFLNYGEVYHLENLRLIKLGTVKGQHITRNRNATEAPKIRQNT